MFAPRPRFNLGLLHHTPGVRHRVPYLTATAGVAGHTVAVARHKLVADEVQGLEVLVLVFLSHVSVEMTLGVNVRETLLNGGDQIPAPAQAALEGHKTTRESLAKDRHQKPHPTPLVRWKIGTPVEMAAQLIDP